MNDELGFDRDIDEDPLRVFEAILFWCIGWPLVAVGVIWLGVRACS